MSGVTASIFREHLTVFDISSNANQYVRDADFWLGMGDDGLGKFGQGIAELGQQIAQLTGNKEAEEKCSNVAGGFATFRDAIGATRWLCHAQKWISGQALWQTDASRKQWRKVLHRDGKPVEIPHEDLNVKWRAEGPSGARIWRNEETGQTSEDGKYIEDPRGDYVLRDWKSIVMDVLIAVGRIFSPISWLNSLKAIDLGKHAKGISAATMAVWGTVLSIGFVASMSDLINEADIDKIKKRAWEAVQGFLDLIALPFDFGVGSAHPVIGIVGKCFNIASAGCQLIREGLFY
jgi:hypothetical protein